MLEFLKNIEKKTDLRLNQLDIGWGSSDMGVLVSFDFEITSLPAILSEIGFDMPGNCSQKTNKVTIDLGYERKREGTSGYSTLVKVSIEGPLKLSDLIDVGDFKMLPDLEKVELLFELDSNTTNDGKVKQSEKDLQIRFKMYLGKTDAQGKNKVTSIIEADYDKKTVNGTVTTTFVAALSSPGGVPLKLDFAPYVPVKLDVKDIFILKTSNPNPSGPETSTILVGTELAMSADIDLSKLPVVGSMLSEAKITFRSFKINYTSAAIPANALSKIDALLNPMGVPAFAAQKSNGADTSKGLEKGFGFDLDMVLGEHHEFKLSSSSFNAPAVPPAANQQPQGGIQPQSPPIQSSKPVPVGKKIGPVTFQSISLGLKNGLLIDVTGSVQLGPLEIDLVDLTLNFPIDRWDPSVLSLGLKGMSINYKKPPVTIAGGFVHDGAEYSGSLAVGLKAFQLSAFGSYGEAGPEGGKYKTFFIYGFLATPPLGSPFLQLTGVALGFGYNRQVDLPAPVAIDSHPLVSPVVTGSIPDFTTMKAKIHASKGDYWAAVGVRIESFKMINTFVLAIFKFGHEFEIDLLGRVSMVFPQNPSGDANTPALAKLDIGIVATILPERGVAEIRGDVLPGSYIHDPTVVLSGGFAVLILSKDQSSGKWNGGKAGDFVLTFGGYSPLYTPKPYYPQNVARMALTWKPFPQLDVKADMYFAVVPEAFMFGGHLSANFNSGGSFNIFVHFNAGLDFIVWWQPKHYIGHAYADLHVGATINVDLLLFSIHKTVEFDINGDITFWGPPFAGHASLSVHFLVSFTVAVDFGAAQNTPQPISWETFQDTLLPAPEKVVSAALTNGMLSKIEIGPKEDIYLVNPKELELDISSAFPLKTVSGWSDPTETPLTKTTIALNSEITTLDDFGIAPMATDKARITSELSVMIKKTGKSNFNFADHFTVEIITKNYPASVWQKVLTLGTLPPPPTQDKNLVNLCGGLVLKAKKPTQDASSIIPSTEFDVITMPDAYWKTEIFSYV